MTTQIKQIMIAGGGITGLTAAYYLQKSIVQQNMPYHITLVDQSNRLGGKIQTERTEGFVIEKGPDSFLARKQAIMELAMDLGLSNELVGTNPQARKNYILHHHRLHLMPPGLILGIPTQVGPFVRTGLISPIGKLRAGLDLFIHTRKEESDESLGHFLKRRLGTEVAENVAEPLLSGIYAGDTENLSLEATFPQFRAMEKKYGSIIKGMLNSRKGQPIPSSQAVAAIRANLPETAKNSMFLTFKEGLITLVEHLEKNLEGVEIKLNKCIKKLVPQEHGYQVEFDNGESQQADAIILATPAFATKTILADLQEAELLAQTPYVSVANVALAFNQEAVNFPLDASGFVVPRNEGRNITACTWTSSKWPHTTPQGNVLLRCYVGHSKDQSLAGLPDDVLLEKVRGDLKEIMGLSAVPSFFRVSRWKNAMPQYRVGHLERLQIVREALQKRRPGIFLAGAGYLGVGIPDCIQQGKDAANQILPYLT